ncbi:E3 ubiquitin-protein ligase AIRP2-like isoform X2 [Cucumis melo]|uniref:E3 ubiquitin-protein ligase AIRP2-like isoform X2 n=2 Tax=Cucumis melo TaxID=3656 RepID=A0ABM3KE99_CUCME|nr:E3 ubiquitin-protein ligase AIRP2-like isoform X2 [Cucumis melo]
MEMAERMLDCYQRLFSGHSYNDFLEFLEADIRHANAFAASFPRVKDDSSFRMKLVCNHLTPVILYLLQWVDCSCSFLSLSYFNLFHIVLYKVDFHGRPDISSYGRKATISEFYSVILPSLQRLCDYASQVESIEDLHKGMAISKRLEHKREFLDLEIEREDECGICFESRTKIVLPNCCHAMCTNCYHDWKSKSESCPFCRGSLKRVASGDLWVLTCGNDVIDTCTVIKEDMLRFYLFINNLPEDTPDVLFLMYYEHLL